MGTGRKSNGTRQTSGYVSGSKYTTDDMGRGYDSVICNLTKRMS